MPGDPDLLFSIVGGQLSNEEALDYEMKSSYTVIARVTDMLNAAGDNDPKIDDEIMVTITVTKVNEAPTFPLGSPMPYVYEGAAGKTVLDPGGLLMATDLDAGDTLIYSLSGTGAGSFSINSDTGKLTSTATLSATDNDYTVTVTATDPGGLFAQTGANINVKAVTESTEEDPNEKPAFLETETGTRSIDEGEDTGRAVGSVDTPGTAEPVLAEEVTDETYTYTLGGTDAASFDIGISSGQLTNKVALDHETKDTYTVMVTANDGEFDSDAQTVTITVNDVAEPPVFEEGKGAVRRVNENTAAGQNIDRPVEATDSDGDTVTYSLETPADDVIFDIVAATGQLQTEAELDHEANGSHTIEVTATSVGSLIDTIEVTIIVGDVNDQPMFDDGSSTTRTVAENTEPGEPINDDDDSDQANDPVTATDDDADDTLTYSLRGTNISSFDIDSTNGQLMTKAMLDYETKHSYAVIVRVSDGEGGSADIPVAITVTNVIEAPKFPSGPITLKVKEDAAATADVGDNPVEATQESGSTGNVTYAVVDDIPGGTDADPFTITTAGQLQLRAVGDDETPLDYETQHSYTVKVTAADDTSSDPPATVDVTITVEDVDEAPMFLDAYGNPFLDGAGNPITTSFPNQNRIVAENVGGNIGAPVVAMDPENKTVIYKLAGADKDSFTIGTNGQLKTAGLDYENPTDVESTDPRNATLETTSMW